MATSPMTRWLAIGPNTITDAGTDGEPAVPIQAMRVAWLVWPEPSMNRPFDPETFLR